MQIYVCVICKVNTPPLFVLSHAHRQLFDAFVSPHVNIVSLKQCRLLSCGECQQLMQSVLKFQETALSGVRHLLTLLPLVLDKSKWIPLIQTQPLPEADKIKTEPDNDSSATASCESDVDLEDSIQIHTVKVEAAEVETRTVAGNKEAGMVVKVPQQLATLPKKTTKAVKLVQSVPKKPCARTSTVHAEDSTDSDSSQTRKASPLPPSPWYTRVLTDEQVASERKARLACAAYAAAAYRCAPCVAAFASAAELAEHAGRHLATAGPYSCDICTQRVRSEKELTEHRSQHTVRYCCCYCDHSATDRQTATRHSCDVKKQQWQKTNFTKHLDGARRRYTRPPRPADCARCGRSFSGPATLAAHTARHHTASEVPVECKVCNKVYKNKFLLKSHSYTHKKKGLEDLRPELFCAECKIAFQKLSTYQKHLLTLKHTTHDTWRFECDYCGKKCPSKAGVKTHILMVHTEVREFKCDRCPKTFVSLNRVQRHGAAHDPALRTRRHVCDQCGKAFVAKKTLSEHLDMHAGVRSHACPLCPATFTFKAALYTHNQLIHLKIKRKWDKKKGKREDDAREMQVKEKIKNSIDPVDQ